MPNFPQTDRIERIHTLLNQGLSERAVGEIMGVSHQRVSAIVNKYIGRENVVRLCASCGNALPPDVPLSRRYHEECPHSMSEISS